MKKVSHIVISVFSLVMLASSAYAQQQTDQDMALQRMQDRLSSMEKNMATMQKELYRSGKSDSKSVPGSDEPIGAEDEKNRAMNGKFEEVEHNISTLAARLDKIIADIDFRLTALEKKVNAMPAQGASATVAAQAPAASNDNTPIDTTALTTPAKTTEDADNAEKQEAKSDEKSEDATPEKNTAAAQYDKAFEYLRLSKYDDAEKAFKNFIANNKGNSLLGNAYFWLGETYYSRQNYQPAAVNYLKGYKDFPKGAKAPDSLFKLGMSLKGLKKDKEACASFEKVKKEYPSADKDLLAKVAAEKKALKCSK